MAQTLKQSTAVDVLIGPFVDLTDGATAETGESPSVKLSKNGQALGAKNDATTPVSDADGYYNCELDATDTNTVGTMILTVAASANALPVRHEFQILEEATYDFLFVAGATPLADINAEADTALTDYDGPTDTEMIARTLVAASYFDPAVDAVATVTTVTNQITAATMADAIWDEALAGHVTADTSGLLLNEWQDGGRLDLILDARMAEASINTTGGAVDVVTLVDTTTTNTDMVSEPATAAANADAVWDEDATGHQTGGTFGQAIGDPGVNTETMYDAVVTDAAGTNVAVDVVAVKAETVNILADTDDIGVAGAGLTDLGGMATAMKAEVQVEANAAAVDVITVDTIAELVQAAPAATPTVASGLMLLYMALRNKVDVTASIKEVHNDAGTVIAKKALSDDATTYSEAEMASGP